MWFSNVDNRRMLQWQRYNLYSYPLKNPRPVFLVSAHTPPCLPKRDSVWIPGPMCLSTAIGEANLLAGCWCACVPVCGLLRIPPGPCAGTGPAPCMCSASKWLLLCTVQGHLHCPAVEAGCCKLLRPQSHLWA